MKICVAQTRPIKGEIDKNIEIHKKFIDLATSKGANMIFFPELSLTGYEPKLAKHLARLCPFLVNSSKPERSSGLAPDSKRGNLSKQTLTFCMSGVPWHV